VVLALSTALLFHGYAHHGIGRASTAPRGSRTPLVGPPLRGAVLDLQDESPRAVVAPDRTIALTFDDGPDPRWTPAVLDVLERHRAPATFFVVGSRVLEHPSLVRRIRREGHELGVHTFSHVDLGALSSWEADLQLSLTQTALAGAAGVRSGLYRPPYSSTTAAMSAEDYVSYRSVARRGYLIALADFDSRDWQRDGVDAIVGRATPPDGAGGVVLFHDGGGERTESVAALERLLTSLEARGYRFVTVGELAGVAPGAALEPSASRAEQAQGLLLRAAMKTGDWVSRAVTILLPLVGLLALLRTAVLLWFARRHSSSPERTRHDPSFTPSVSVVVPAFNEEAGIAEAVRSLAAGDYPDVEVIVVDDGSTDRTWAIVHSLDLPNVRLIAQPNTGKPAALNRGLAAASGDIVVMVDGDTIFEQDTLRHLVQPFADPTVGAVAGNTKVANRRGFLGRWQHIEYVMGFNLDRRMYEQLRCMPTVPGAIGAFRRPVLEGLGGVAADTLAEDTDLTMAVGRAGWNVAYEPRARAWTEVPASTKALWQQRYRWSYGTMQAMWKHRSALRPSARSPLGWCALPYMLTFQVLFPLLAPLIDLFAIYGVLFLDRTPVLALWLGFMGLQLALALVAFRLDGEPVGRLWAMPLQQVVYRQLLYLVVMHAAVTAVLGAPLRWHKLARTGDFSSALEATRRARP
jgi:cellulose synthase/poly-beta-1,6-N-acetylglucosamine synthase-like glycosyltransferase/peptidoglycan/xylan/chitin deacetylase (PgdA/CDA1 family)